MKLQRGPFVPTIIRQAPYGIKRSRYYIINRRGGFQVIPRRRPAQRLNLRALQSCPLRLPNILQHRRRVGLLLL